MNELFQQLMAGAARSTQRGRLAEATQTIQRALRGMARDGSLATPPPQTPAAFNDTSQPLVLDGLVRVIDDTPAPVGSVDRPDAVRSECWQRASFTHQGRTLAYRLYLPPTASGATARRPMVVMLHGCTQNADDFAAGTQMNMLARDLGVVVLYPEQTKHDNAQNCWNWFKPQHQRRGRGEPAVIAALAQSISAEHQVDPARVYVAGLSAGGAMADIVGHCYPDVFAAVGVHSGLPQGCAADVMSALSVMRSGNSAAAASERRASALPTIVFHGDADPTVHVSNGEAIARAVSSAGSDGLSGAPGEAGQVTARATEGVSSQGERHTRTVYADAGGKTRTEYWQLHGAGHAWSGGSASASYTNPNGVDASAEMLRFFLAHPRVR